MVRRRLCAQPVLQAFEQPVLHRGGSLERGYVVRNQRRNRLLELNAQLPNFGRTGRIVECAFLGALGWQENSP